VTYCIGVALESGLVMLSDTRTNAGVDDIATFGKMFVWEKPDDRVITLCTAGNLAVSQAVVNMLEEGLPGDDGEIETLWSVPSMFRAARLVSRAVRSVFNEHGPAMKAQDTSFSLSLLLGGQLAGRELRLFQVYSAGNFIEATKDTPYLQIGEHKYGKPILDRTLTFTSPVEDAVKAGLISMDSTLRSNLSVGLPMDLLVYRRDAPRVGVHRRLDESDAYFVDLRKRWSEALRDAYQSIDAPDWLDGA
jgi:putative proteasome-type protease